MKQMLAIRRAGAADVDAVWALCQTVKRQLAADGLPIWGAEYPLREIFAGDAAQNLLVAERDGQLIGSLSYNGDIAGEYFFEQPAVAAAQSAAAMLAAGGVPAALAVSPHRLMVAPCARHGGVAETLMRAFEAACAGRRSVLFASPANTPGLRLYAKLGYRDLGEYPFAFGAMRYLVKAL